MLLETRGKETQVVPEFVYKERLPNGLRVLVHEMPWAQSVCVRLLVAGGHCDEDQSNIGMAHFLEEMIARGSVRYPSYKAINEKSVALGGKVTKFSTGDEYMQYGFKVGSENLPHAVSLLREVVFNPLLREGDIRGVKKQLNNEINSERDDLKKYRWKYLKRCAWGTHPLGYNRLGTNDSVAQITRDSLLDFYGRQYRPDRLILTICGGIKQQEVLPSVKESFQDLVLPDKPLQVAIAPVYTPGEQRVFVETRDREIVHILLAFSTEGHGLRSPREPIYSLLRNIAGPEIFYRLYDESSIAYEVSATDVYVTDNGLMTFNATVAPGNVERAVDEMVEIVRDLSITEESAANAKTRRKTGFIDIESTNSFADFIGDQELFTGQVKSLVTKRREIDDVTIEQLALCKQELFSRSNVCLVLLGGVTDSIIERLDSKLKFA